MVDGNTAALEAYQLAEDRGDKLFNDYLKEIQFYINTKGFAEDFVWDVVYSGDLTQKELVEDGVDGVVGLLKEYLCESYDKIDLDREDLWEVVDNIDFSIAVQNVLDEVIGERI